MILPAAEADLAALSASLRTSVLRRLKWLRQNADAVVHYRLHNLPDDLSGLCRLRHGDYRILYWLFTSTRTIKVYRVQHRSDVYRDL